MSPDENLDQATLVDLVAACSKAIAFTKGLTLEEFENDPKVIAASAYQIAVIGEAVKRLSMEMRDRHSDVPWKDIAGMRDRLIHAYDDIDLEVLWRTATRDVPRLLEELRKISEAA